MSIIINTTIKSANGDRNTYGVHVECDADTIDGAEAAIAGAAMLRKGLRTGDTDATDAGSCVHAEFRSDAALAAKATLRSVKAAMVSNLDRGGKARLAFATMKLANRFMRGA